MKKVYVLYDVKNKQFYAGISGLEPFFEKHTFAEFDTESEALIRLEEESKLYPSLIQHRAIVVLPVYKFE